jgi:hypothetical protein
LSLDEDWLLEEVPVPELEPELDPEPTPADWFELTAEPEPDPPVEEECPGKAWLT